MTPAKPAIAKGIYKHYKGNLYEVKGLARHSETDEWLVVYHRLEDPENWWVRPATMFVEQVSLNGQEVCRFEHLR